MFVVATDKFEEKQRRPYELDHIPKKGEEFEVTEDRFEILAGKNECNIVFVEKAKKSKPLDLNLKKGLK